MAGFTITIKAGHDVASSSVEAYGRVEHIITSDDRKALGLDDSALKAAVDKYHGRAPTDAYLCSPTPWEDLYKRYQWREVNVVASVAGATITGITSEPQIVASRTFTNNSSKKAAFNASVSDQKANTVESNWSKTTTIKFQQMFKYNISLLGAGGGGETTFGFEKGWQEGGSRSTTITVGSQQGLNVDLEPGESVEAVLSASRGVMKVRVRYNVSLYGDTAVNYYPKFQDHHFYSLDINGVMKAASMPTEVELTEDLEIGYFSNAKIELKDAGGQVKGTLRL